MTHFFDTHALTGHHDALTGHNDLSSSSHIIPYGNPTLPSGIHPNPGGTDPILSPNLPLPPYGWSDHAGMPIGINPMLGGGDHGGATLFAGSAVGAALPAAMTFNSHHHHWTRDASRSTLSACGKSAVVGGFAGGLAGGPAGAVVGAGSSCAAAIVKEGINQLAKQLRN